MSLRISLILCGLAAICGKAYAEAPALECRAALHEGYARLVLDGSATSTEFTAVPDQEGGHLAIGFNRPVTLSLDKLRRALAGYVDDVKLDANGAKLTAHLLKKVTLKQSHVRPYVEAIDLVDAKPEPDHAAPSPASAPQPAKTATLDTEAARPGLPVALVKDPGSDTKRIDPPAEVSSPPITAKTTAALPPKSVAVPQVGKGKTPAPGPASDPTPPTADGGLHFQTLISGEGAVSLRFDWATATSAAIFRREDTIWIVFDHADKFVSGDALGASRGALLALAQVPSRTGTVIRVVTKDALYPWVRRAGSAWVVDLKPRKQPVDGPVEPVFRKDDAHTIADFQALDPAVPIGVFDPETRDLVIAVPLPQLGQGSDTASDFPDFRVLQTTQGLAFRPYSDQLSVQQQTGQVEVTAPRGLTLASDADRDMAPRAASASSKLLTPKDWASRPHMDFATRQQILLHAAATAEADDRTNARLDLAKFYFANGLAPEALGVLYTAEADVPNLTDDPVVRLMQGASELMMRHLDTAATDLGNSAIDGRADSLMWRAVLAAEQGNWHDAASFALQGKNAIGDYSAPLKRIMALSGAEALLRSGYTREAGELADIVLETSPTSGQRDLALVLKGRISAETGDLDAAMADWKKVADSPVADLGRAQASFALTATKLDKKQISLTDAIDAMDRLRFVWRGDDFEVTVLRKLAELYAQDTNYRLAFQTLARVPTVFPDTTAAKDALARMQGMFTDIFLGPTADKVAPVSAVAIYEEFKELTPPGAQGDEIIRKLADRLVAVDLLGRAGDLLLDQAKNRLTGAAQARVALQLALVRLMDHRAQEAMPALDLISDDGLTPELAVQRQELRARALAELGQSDAALTALLGDDSVDADKLRADILLKAQRWLPLAALLQKNLPDVAETESLTSTQAATVLRAAVGLVLGGDRAGLQSLQARYATAMDNSPEYKDAFRVIAGGIDTQGADFQSLADKVAQIGDLQSFMSGYRQKVQQDKLSAIN